MFSSFFVVESVRPPLFWYDKAASQAEDARWAGIKRYFTQSFCPSKHSDTLGCAGKFQTLRRVIYRVTVEYQFT